MTKLTVRTRLTRSVCTALTAAFTVCEMYAAEAEEVGLSTQAMVRVTVDTNGVCQSVYAQVGDSLRKGDAIAAIVPFQAEKAVEAARNRLTESEEVFRAARTNFLAVTSLREQGKASEVEQDRAERTFNAASLHRQEMVTSLQAVYQQARSRVIYAVCSGTVVAVNVAAGQAVHAGDVAIEMQCETDAPAAPAAANSSAP